MAEGGGRRERRGQGIFIHRFHRLAQMEKGWLRNLKQAETGIFLRAICVNLCESVDNPSPLSRIRVIRVIRGHTLCSSGFLLNVSFLFCEEFGG